MGDSQYNGWANYETWRVHLELFDTDQAEEDENDVEFPTGVTCRLADSLRTRAEDAIEASAPPGLARDYALAFIDRVSWLEIAHAVLDRG